MDKIRSRRLKKLRNRANKGISQSNTGQISGIHTWAEADELFELMKLQAEQQDKDRIKQGGRKKDEGSISDVSEKEEKSSAPFLSSTFCTSLHVKDGSSTTTREEWLMDPKKWKVVDATNHRDLIASLLLHSGKDPTTAKKKNKRRHQDEYPAVTIPNWIRIHNPVLLRNLAVIEFNIDDFQSHDNPKQAAARVRVHDDVDDPSIHIMPSTRLINEMIQLQDSLKEQDNKNNDEHPPCNFSTITKLLMGNTYIGRTILPFKTQIQGQPKSITDVLMYFPTKNESEIETSSSSKSLDGEVNASTADNSCSNHTTSEISVIVNSDPIIATMYKELVLSDKELQNEGFPLPKESRSSTVIPSIHEDTESPYILRLMNVSSTWDQDITIGLYDKLPFEGDDSLHIVQTLAIDIEDSDDNYLEAVHTPDSSLSGHPKFYISSCLSRDGGLSSVKAFAIDCEMVETIHGRELARVTVLHFKPSKDNEYHYSKILDSFVKPAAKIIDYKTEYSGISPTSLLNVTTKIEDIQATLASLIFKDDIIIGHSLENDLSVLRFSHKKIVDTAVLFRGEDNRRMSLRYLSKVLLQKTIQAASGTEGHDSAEDAAASLLLAIKRARLGPTFHLKRKCAEKINILDTIQNISKTHPDKVCSRIQDTLACIGPNNWIKQHVAYQSTAHALSCETIDDSTVNALNSWLRSSHRKTSILWASLNVDGSNAKLSNQKIDTVLDKVLLSSLDSLILVVFQRGFKRTDAMSKQKSVTKNPRVTLKWTLAQEDVLNRHIDRSQLAEAFWITNA